MTIDNFTEDPIEHAIQNHTGNVIDKPINAIIFRVCNQSSSMTQNRDLQRPSPQFDES